ncbi:MAG: AAA family ATPase [Chloroflexi bacterium]|nr:R3H domain-containing nucleic acid-binding protein [Anaerolineaceae bacterium]NMB90687.1 AAA family ATPase [Chloroflexota bacterium]
MGQRYITDDIQALMDVLPPRICDALVVANNTENLLEIVMDLGRVPMARFVKDELPLSEREISHEDIEFVVSRIGDFDADNRAGLERTLHRISAIRNRRAHIVGLTARVGRAVYGTIDIIEDLVESDKSILILGQPGIGKTTMLREAARILAEQKRVIIVDTSNEIGGDGDVPHPAVGRARRMQVAMPSLQHEVMIEAVENHNPEVIVIDEIGRELEAAAARTIAERGVQLIGTAHGRTLENLLLNPTLSDLVGGIESVTLSDEEARRRGTQKTVLERRAPPTFDVLIEIKERDYLVIHPDVAAAVDTMLRGYSPQTEVRYRNSDDEVVVEKATAPALAGRSQAMPPQGGRRGPAGAPAYEPPLAPVRQGSTTLVNPPLNNRSPLPPEPADLSEGGVSRIPPVRVYPYGVARNRLMQAAKRLGVPVVVVRDQSEAEVLMTLRTYFRSHQQPILEAEERGMPIYVLRANTVNQMEQSLAEMFSLAPEAQAAVREDYSAQTQEAIETVLNGQRWADLPPASAAIRRIQHEMARQANLVSHSYGKEPHRRVRIFRE